MNDDRLRYIFHLDNLRQKKNITVKELCNNICSDRQYRKYLSGVNNISDQRIAEFCEVLGISTRDFYYTLNQKDQYIFNSIKVIYSKLISKSLKEAYRLLDEFRDIDNITNQNFRFLNYCRIRFDYDDNRVLPEGAIDRIKKYIPYPDCKDSEAYDFVDILFLLLISKIETKKENETGLNILLKILSNNEMIYLTAENRNIIPPIYANTSLMLGSLNKLHECLRISLEGIGYCKKHSFSSSLTWLYYSASIAHKKLDHQRDSKYYALLCMSSAIANNKPSVTSHFYNLLSSDFNNDPYLLFNELKEITLTIPSN